MNAETGSSQALVAIHQALIRDPGPTETCAAWRAYCREHGCRWITTWDTQPYRETPGAGLDLAGHARFEEIPTERLQQALLRIIEIEGPVHRNLLTRRLLQAAGFARAGSRTQARIEAELEDLHRRQRLWRQGEFAGQPEQFAVPCLRIWTGLPDPLRQLEHVSDGELTLSLVRTVTEAGRLAPRDAMNDALHRMGFIRLTENARRRMEAPLASALSAGLLLDHNGLLEPGIEAFRIPRTTAPKSASDPAGGRG